MTLFCDKSSAISISKNTVQHSWTKRIDIRHHFNQEVVEDKEIELEYASTNKQLVDIDLHQTI